MSEGLRPGLPDLAYQLGSLCGVYRPSLKARARSFIPLIACLVIGMLGGAVFGSRQIQGTADGIQQVIFTISAFLTVVSGVAVSGLFRNSRGLLLTLTEGIVIIVPDWDRKNALVYRWSDLKQTCSGPATNLPAGGEFPVPDANSAEFRQLSAAPLALGKNQFTIRTIDGKIWTFGSDLNDYLGLRRQFETKGGLGPVVEPRLQR